MTVACAVYWRHLILGVLCWGPPVCPTAPYSYESETLCCHETFLKMSEWQSRPLHHVKKCNFSGFTSYSSVALREVPSFETLSAEMESLKRHLSQTESPTVLCHNDLLTKNIIYNHKEGEERSCTSGTLENTVDVILKWAALWIIFCIHEAHFHHSEAIKPSEYSQE